MPDQLIIYSVGHSDYSIEKFIDLLNKYNINYLVDVRSSPYSKRIPQFNRELLRIDLKDKGINYLYLGNKLGGRYSDPNLLFDNKQVNFEKVRETNLFIEGLNEMIDLVKQNNRVAFMCAEKDPFNCHRFALVSRALSLIGVEVRHMLEDGNYILNDELDEKLLKKYKCDYDQANLFEKTKTREDALTEAYRLRNKDIAYSNEENGG
jgi:uncharacterized protein (DUF488 family)